MESRECDDHDQKATKSQGDMGWSMSSCSEDQPTAATENQQPATESE